MADKNDVFVGNVTFNTTEEQLHEIFSFVGPVKNIRILTDKETGRPKGFAFIEYMDANTALAAIRRLDGRELNGRKLRVSYSNNSNLRDLARQIGQEVSENPNQKEYQAVTNLQLHEAWDILDIMRKMAVDDKDGKLKDLLESYPQLIGALLQIQRRLGIVTAANPVQASQPTVPTTTPTNAVPSTNQFRTDTFGRQSNRSSTGYNIRHDEEYYHQQARQASNFQQDVEYSHFNDGFMPAQAQYRQYNG